MSDDSKLILEGGAGGHMAHPFELSVVKTGQDLKNFFLQAAEHLQEKPGATKIDGTNVSFKIVGQDTGERQFAIDRGSLQEIDVNGVTIDRVSERFKVPPPEIDPETGEPEIDPETGETIEVEHGMVRMCTMTLRILNSALDEIQPELEALGMWDDPSIYINTEFVEGTTNVTKYDYNFLALHVVQQFYEKPANRKTKAGKPTGKLPRPGLPRPMTTVVDDETGEEKQVIDKKIKSKLLSSADGIDPSALKTMVKKLKPFAERFNFKVFDTIPTQLKQPKKGSGTRAVSLVKDVQSALSSTFEVKTSDNSISNTLDAWLKQMDSKGGIPKSTFIHTPSGKAITPLSKACYMHIAAGKPVEDMIEVMEKGNLGAPAPRNADKVEEEFNSAIFGAVVTETTRVLGNAIMAGLETENAVMGDMSNHEGIVLKLEDMVQYKSMSGLVKITGQFIVDGATGTAFGTKPTAIGEGEADEEEDIEQDAGMEMPLQDLEIDSNPEPDSTDQRASHKRRLVVFPGKFKPPHKGHLGLVMNMTKHLARPQDRVLVLISPLSVHTDDGLEISAKDSKNLWNLYLESVGLTKKVRVLISPINSPVKAAYAVLDNEVDGFETMPGDYIIPGASTKMDDKSGKPDWSRFERFDTYKPNVQGVTLGNAEEWAVPPFVDESGIEFSATNFRIAVDNREGLDHFLPDGISEEMFMKIITNANVQEAKEGEFQKKMKKRLAVAHKRLLDQGGQKNTSPYTVSRVKNSNAFLAEQEIEEMSTAGGVGASIEGAPNSNKKKRKKKTSYNVSEKTGDNFMSYEQFAEEIKLRNVVSEWFIGMRKETLSEKRNSILEKIIFKNAIRSLIYEVAVQDPKDDPHENTGINKLDQLLRNIIPTIEEDYKSLTTDIDQRKSFRAHILHAVRHLLAPAQASERLEDEDSEAQQMDERSNINLDIDSPDEEKFIDIYKDKKKEETDPVEEFGIDGEDETGRNTAYDCFQKIEKQILKAFKLLGNENDRELFYDYLLTNLKLYFDQFEKDLTNNLDEPTTDEYEDQSNLDNLDQNLEDEQEQLGV